MMCQSKLVDPTVLFAVFVSTIDTDPSGKPLARTAPSLLYTRAVAVAPSKAILWGWLESPCTSQMRVLASLSKVTSSRPSGLKATTDDAPEPCVSNVLVAFPVFTSQTHAVPSKLVVAARSPSGLKRAFLDGVAVPFKGLSDLAGGHIPQVSPVPAVHGRQHRLVPIEDKDRRLAGQAGKPEELDGLADVPDGPGAVECFRREVGTLRAEDNFADTRVVSVEDGAGSAGGRVPEPDRRGHSPRSLRYCRRG